MKRKRPADNDEKEEDEAVNAIDTSKPTATFKRPPKGRAYTVSVAIPGSIVDTEQTMELKTLLAGSLARALAVFCVDEIVIFDDGYDPARKRKYKEMSSFTSAWDDPIRFLYNVLSYMELPPYMRKRLFPKHSHLSNAGSLPSLDMPHHVKPEDSDCLFREGITTFKLQPDRSKMSSMTHAYIGAFKSVKIANLQEELPIDVRVTLKLPSGYVERVNAGKLVEAEIVRPETPREEQGYYWGFSVRTAGSLSEVFEDCPFDGGYDFCIGTSERGTPLRDLVRRGVASQGQKTQTRKTSVANGDVGMQSSSGDDDDDESSSSSSSSSSSGDDDDDDDDDGEEDEEEQQEQQEQGTTEKPIPRWKHLLLTFGGVAGLEEALRHDEKLRKHGVKQVSSVFDEWINLVEGQGSRTIRTVEAVWIGLMGLKDFIAANAEK